MKPRFIARVRFLSFLLVLFALVLIGKLYNVQIVRGEEYSQKADRQYSKPESRIFSRGGIFFENRGAEPFKAATLNACFIVALQPNKISDPEAAWREINAVIPIEREVFLERAGKKDDPYEEIAKKITPEKADAVIALKLSGVQVFEDRCRLYPGENLASHAVGLLGFKGDELGGRYGLERYYEDTLARKNAEGYTNFFAEIFTNIKKTIFEGEELQGDVYTSLELQTQFFLEKKLAEINKKWSSEMSGGIVMDPKTGEIVAMAVNPTFNPNSFQGENVSVFSNPLVESVYEMGSIIKPLTIAAGIDAGVITAKTTYKDEGFLVLNTARIANYDGVGRGVVDMQTVLSKSLNTGVAFVVSKLGNSRFADYFKALELGEETGIDLPNETRGLIQNLDSTRDIEYATASYGQGIAMTPIETVRALSARRTRTDTAADQGGAGACPVRDHPPIPRRQWPRRAAADHVAALRRRAAAPAAALCEPVLEAAPRRLLRTARRRAAVRRLGGVARILRRRRDRRRDSGRGLGQTHARSRLGGCTAYRSDRTRGRLGAGGASRAAAPADRDVELSCRGDEAHAGDGEQVDRASGQAGHGDGTDAAPARSCLQLCRLRRDSRGRH